MSGERGRERGKDKEWAEEGELREVGLREVWKEGVDDKDYGFEKSSPQTEKHGHQNLDITRPIGQKGPRGKGNDSEGRKRGARRASGFGSTAEAK